MTRVDRRREGQASETEKRFEAIALALGRNPAVTHSEAGSRLFGSSTLKVHDKIFAMVSFDGLFVVKLPKARVDALVSAGQGERFDTHRDRPMKEWLELRSGSAEEWLALAREALEFVGT